MENLRWPEQVEAPSAAWLSWFNRSNSGRVRRSRFIDRPKAAKIAPSRSELGLARLAAKSGRDQFQRPCSRPPPGEPLAIKNQTSALAGHSSTFAVASGFGRFCSAIDRAVKDLEPGRCCISQRAFRLALSPLGLGQQELRPSSQTRRLAENHMDAVGTIQGRISESPDISIAMATGKRVTVPWTIRSSLDDRRYGVSSCHQAVFHRVKFEGATI